MTGDFERVELSAQGSERELLQAFLDFQRQTLEWKCSGLTLPLAPSATRASSGSAVSIGAYPYNP